MVRDRINKIITKSIAIAIVLTMITPNIITATRFTKTVSSRDPDTSTGTKSNKDRIVVLDPGHGKSFFSMSESEYSSNGFIKNANGKWGEWRHWKNGTYGEECNDTGCTKTGNSCWYNMTDGERDIEPEINLNNTLAAKKYLEEMGYTVRITRDSSTHPSFTKRASYCFPNNDTSQNPDAELFVCIHSNAGGGSGTSYISAEGTGGTFAQKYIPSDYISRCKTAGDMINKKVAAASGLKENGPIPNNLGYIAFNKNPIPTAYLEIGFFDNESDLGILQSKSDEIGKAIAEGVNEYLQSVEPSVNTGTTASGGSSTSASKGKITIRGQEEKFLGLWKNSVGYYVPYYSDPDNAKYNPDGIEVAYGKYGHPVATILQTEQWLFDLLQGDRTQEHLKLMKYLMQIYSRKKLWSRII